MNIFCRVDDCRYIESGFCTKGDISVSEDCECEDYESYLDTEEFKNPFWKRMRDSDNNRACRVKYYGKRIEINGRVFFAESKSKYANLTDEVTGCCVGSVERVKDRFKEIIKIESKWNPSLEELPVATYDEKTRVFTYEKGGEQE